MWETDAFSICIRKCEWARDLPRGLWRSSRHLEHSSGGLRSRFSGVPLHRSLGVPPRIRTSRDRSDFTLDIPAIWIPVPEIRFLAVSFEFPSADKIFYLILQIKASYGRMPGRIMEQAELVLVFLRHLPFQRCGGSKVNLALRVDENYFDGGSELLVFVIPWFASSTRPWSRVAGPLFISVLLISPCRCLGRPLFLPTVSFGAAARVLRSSRLLRSSCFRVDVIPGPPEEVGIRPRGFLTDGKREGSIFTYRRARSQK